MEKQMRITLCGVQIYQGNLSPFSVGVVGEDGKETTLFSFNPDAVQVRGEEIVRLIEENSKRGTLRVHPSAVKEF